ncbi:hypothetical protein LCGC14_1204070 [marine sediment metagenome]|uniref:Uncharacterized protein n=1 Tax=marine sediment metagenome TaxID=412755 RepID=A0A0F9LKF1_9ZZZZ
MRRAFVVVESETQIEFIAYGHIRDVYGPFPTCRVARTAANRLASKEENSHLTFGVRRLYKREGIGSRVLGTFKGKPRRAT